MGNILDLEVKRKKHNAKVLRQVNGKPQLDFIKTLGLNILILSISLLVVHFIISLF